MRKEVRERILNRDGRKCLKCGSKENLQIDHIIPICRGGRENEDNMQVLCRTCNYKKGRGIDFEQYFIIDESPDYILLRRDTPLYAFSPGEFHKICEFMFERNRLWADHQKTE